MITMVGNVGQGGISGFTAMLGAGDLASDFTAASYAGMPPIDVFPAVGSALLGAGDPAHAVTDDFNCQGRPGGALDAGAYAFAAAGNPGWIITEGFKDCAGEGGSDTGADGTAGDSEGDSSGGVNGADTSQGATAATASAGEGSTSEGADDNGGSGGCGCDLAPVRFSGWQWLTVLIGMGLTRRRRGSAHRGVRHACRCRREHSDMIPQPVNVARTTEQPGPCRRLAGPRAATP